MIAFTNHALDHLLCSVLDAGITQNVVRLGSRSTDERISRFSIEAMEEVAGRSRLDRAFAKHHRELKLVEEEIKELMKDCLRTSVDTPAILRHLEVAFPLHFQGFLNLPPWVNLLYDAEKSTDDASPWTRVGKGGQDTQSDGTPYAYWLTANDLHFLQGAHAQVQNQDATISANETRDVEETNTGTISSTNQFSVLDETGTDAESSNASVESLESIGSEFDDDISPEEEWMYATEEVETPALDATQTTNNATLTNHDSEQPINHTSPGPLPTPGEPGMIQASDFRDIRVFFEHFGYAQIPLLPMTDRSLDVLLEMEVIWEMSHSERTRLHAFWSREVRVALQEERIMEFERLRKKHADVLQRYNEGKAEVRAHSKVPFMLSSWCYVFPGSLSAA